MNNSKKDTDLMIISETGLEQNLNLYEKQLTDMAHAHGNAIHYLFSETQNLKKY